MTFIEQLFHIDPDAGSGLFEGALVLIGVSLLAFAVRRATKLRGEGGRK
jgi:hypothetical protein